MDRVAPSTDHSNDRYNTSSSPWVRSFACNHLKVLIVCRGPIRKETMDVFEELGIVYGILISEKDSVTYPHTLAPELRVLKDQDRIHRIPDYTGVTAEERRLRVQQIIGFAKQFSYTHVFAGYGFMAEDADFVESLEKAGVGFMGPASGVHRQAGAKDEAKKIARSVGIHITPGVDNISALTLLRKVADLDGLKTENDPAGIEALKALAQERELTLAAWPESAADAAEMLLQAGYAKGVGLIELVDLQRESELRVGDILQANPGRRLRLKYIGGGGGKGQRIVTSVDEVANAVFEVLSESRVTGSADNKNFLIEMNIENTRHNEIQVAGNGVWTIALGGRDCSVQMHEQKLVELSITDELYDHEIRLAGEHGQQQLIPTLNADRQMLRTMEEQSVRFGSAVSLNSVSTFECIVSGHDFFFMEMNTRIQVEHRVTEMAYRLRFINSQNQSDNFVVESLVELMALLAAHGSRLPQPKREVRHLAGGEIRLNATNDALQPHAGGMIEYWSTPIEHEIRDDQGIGVLNPDTHQFMRYYLAGAYDSNIALLVTYGNSRRELMERLANMVRSTELRGADLQTNLDFHYGILNFSIGLHPMCKPDTKFVIPYLAAVGSIAKLSESIDLDYLWERLRTKVSVAFGPEAARDAFEPKLSLLMRPMESLLSRPHALVGWLILNRNRCFRLEDLAGETKIVWLKNPLFVLSDLYRYTHLEARSAAAPSQQIWEHDHELLELGLSFYNDLIASLPAEIAGGDFGPRDRLLRGDAALAESSGLAAELLEECRSAHAGWQLGLEWLDLPIRLGIESGIFGFCVDEKLEPLVPAEFCDPARQKELIRALAPPPKASGDEIVALMGGMFYSRETPEHETYLNVGQHFNVGDTIYIIEVMKMFNKIKAEFSGVVEEIYVTGDAGTVVRKGQPLFKVCPDEVIHVESEAERSARHRSFTDLIAGKIELRSAL